VSSVKCGPTMTVTRRTTWPEFGASPLVPIGGSVSASLPMVTRPTLIMSIIPDGDVTTPMHNPSHPGLTMRHDCLEPLGLTVTEGASATVLCFSAERRNTQVAQQEGP
jgi:hypothetical protein